MGERKEQTMGPTPSLLRAVHDYGVNAPAVHSHHSDLKPMTF